MYTASINMPHITGNTEYGSRFYQSSGLETGSNHRPNASNVAGYHPPSSIGYLYGNMEGYVSDYAQPSVPMALRHCESVEDRSSENYVNLTPSRNIYPNSLSHGHEYFPSENMDQNRDAFAQSESQGQGNSRRSCRGNTETSAARKNRSWTDAVFASMDREGESILDLVNEDAMELERIAATIKQDCRSPNSVEAFLPNDFSPLSLPPIGASNDMSFSRWCRPQYCEPSQRRKRLSGSERYAPDDYLLSGDFQSFSIDSTPGPDYRYGEMLGLNQLGHFNNPSLGAYPRNSYQQHGFISDLQTYPGASFQSNCRESFGSENMRAGCEVMLSETSHAFYRPKERTQERRVRSKMPDADDTYYSESHNMKREKSKRTDYKQHRLDIDEYRGHMSKRKCEYPEEHDSQAKKPKYYFEQEDHYIVHKWLRELSATAIPSELPRTTSASLFYRLLSSKAEPRVMQTIAAPQSTSSRSQKKIVIKEDVTQDQIGKYSKIGDNPFVYIHGASSRASPTKSIKLIELLTSKKPPVVTESGEKDGKEAAVDCSENKSDTSAKENEKETCSEGGNDAIR